MTTPPKKGGFIQRRSGMSQFRGKGSRVNPVPPARVRADLRVRASRGAKINKNFY